MVHLCLGWKIASVCDSLFFETDSQYDRPKPVYGGVVNKWWTDLFGYLRNFGNLNVLACSPYMDFFSDEEEYFIGVLVEFGWVLSNNNYHPEDYGAAANPQDFRDLMSFFEVQKLNNPDFPTPKIHISEWYEHGFNFLEDQISMTLADEREFQKWQDKREKGLCDIKGCKNKADTSHKCLVCMGQYCDEHQDKIVCGCGMNKI